MIPNQILGIPIIEAAAPGNFVAQQERELFSQIQVAIDMLRCPSCGSLNYREFRLLGVWNYGYTWGSAPDPGIL